MEGTKASGQAKALMILHTQDAFVKLFIGEPTAARAWKKLEDNFEKRSNARVIELRKRLASMRLAQGAGYRRVPRRVPRDQSELGSGRTNRYRRGVGVLCASRVAKGVCNSCGDFGARRDGVERGRDPTEAHAKGAKG